MYRKMIVYDRKDQDFMCYLDGEYQDRKPTYVEAERFLNELVYQLLIKKDVPNDTRTTQNNNATGL